MPFLYKAPRHALCTAALLCALFLAGCAGSKAEDMPCPDTGLILAASKLTSFNTETASEADMVVDATLGNYRGACRFRQETLEFMLEVDIAARRGAAGDKLKKAAFPYFVAILDPAENVLQRQGFSTTVSFDNTGNGVTTEKHILRLPLPDKKTVRQHKVVIGFELTPEQLAYNRRHEKPAVAVKTAPKTKKK